MSQHKDPNQSEGDRVSARRSGKRRPRSGRFATVDEIVAKGHSVIERVQPMVRRAVGNLRKRFGK